MPRPTRKAIAAITAALLVIMAALVIPGLLKESEDESGEESLSEFARERAELHARRLPLAVVREKLEKGKEGGGEIASGRVRGRPRPRRGTWMSARTSASIAPSFRCPPVTTLASGRPRPSTALWILVVSPPRERPMP